LGSTAERHTGQRALPQKRRPRASRTLWRFASQGTMTSRLDTVERMQAFNCVGVPCNLRPSRPSAPIGVGLVLPVQQLTQLVPQAPEIVNDAGRRP